jgi:hypothetical protein
MQLTTFSTKDVIKFTLMTPAERNDEIAKRLMRMYELENNTQSSLSAWSEYNGLKEEVSSLTEINVEVINLAK